MLKEKKHRPHCMTHQGGPECRGGEDDRLAMDSSDHSRHGAIAAEAQHRPLTRQGGVGFKVSSTHSRGKRGALVPQAPE